MKMSDPYRNRRLVVLDTETTGINVKEGHRIIEIGCIEIMNRRITGRRFHCYLNPDRKVDTGAFEVHGISDDFLKDKPHFSDVVDDFLAFLDQDELIIHNASFDTGFINAELSRLFDTKASLIESRCKVTDSLEMARKKHPGQRNNLDSLCRRYGIDNSNRDLHGALLDAELLAMVFLAMTGGQSDFLESHVESSLVSHDDPAMQLVLGTSYARPSQSAFCVIAASPEETSLHLSRLQAIHLRSDQQCLWLNALNVTLE